MTDGSHTTIGENMGNDTQKIKLLALWDILNKHTDEDHPMHTDEIIAALREKGISASRKVLPQDIDTLNAYGYEVLSFKKKFHYYYVVNRPFDAAEVVMLADVVKASKLTISQKKNIIGKLTGTLCSHRAASLSKNIVSFGQGKSGNCYIIYSVDAIDKAITENRQVSFRYFKYDENHEKVYGKNGERYIANPVVMVWSKDNYYLLCFSKGHDNIVTYRLDRMEDVKTEPTEREPHREYEVFNSEEYRKQVFNMFGGELSGVTLLFSPELLTDVYDRFGDNLKITVADDKAYSVSVKVQVSRPFFLWVIGSEGKVRIKSPQKVLKAFNVFMTKIKEAY